MDTSPQEYIVQDRATYITEEMLGLTLCVYNGMKFFNILIENDKIGYRIGEFAPTKKKAAKKKKVKKKK
jgi:small subunit ribosomal protein S19